ncbi:tetratricopeptide repeat protein [Maribacter litopenaei]|uniref:Tetratricopeptide repeat protein n=1 Tax=Maribacter litopenaei TaxID=2976127 RepID=A0ABY5YBC4_9FLAO|nr:tetratricopeptide repeat protein [Maribacter litopenaei]UWX56136.1 tetratricopeptide repeat protein [Maribacter litopenaei]
MKRSFLVLLFGFLCFLLAPMEINSQDVPSQSENYFQQFKELPNSTSRIDFFFDTSNRYNQNSAYDWLDTVNVYLISSQKINDSAAVSEYQMIQSKIYYDLGDYERSLSIAKDLFDDMEEYPLEWKSLILNIMDDDYSKLELYDKQIEIRRYKRELGLTERVSFYDIYSSLGQHRKAMEDYMTEEKNTIEEGDFYGQAIYNNTIGNYLLLDKSTPTALSYFNKANALIDVYFSDVINTKTSNEVNEGNHLKGVILGNIGKSYVQLKEYEKAIPYLEEGIELIKKHNTGKVSTELVENTLEIAECYLQLNNYEKATDYLSKDLIPVKIKNILKKNRLYAAYYDRTGDYKSANEYLKQNNRIRDSLDDNDTNIKSQQLESVLKQDLENSEKNERGTESGFRKDQE